jgi:hypothetical protein
MGIKGEGRESTRRVDRKYAEKMQGHTRHNLFEGKKGYYPVNIFVASAAPPLSWGRYIKEISVD